MEDRTILQDAFYGGIVRDDKSNILGAASNIEEVDIFSNKDWVQAEQIMSADSLPANSELYAYDAGDDDTLYGYGKTTASTNIQLFSLASSGDSNPGAWASLFTSATGAAVKVESPLAFHKHTADKYVYYLTGTNTLKKYGPIAGTPAESTVGTLSGLDGTFDRPWMRRAFGELYIGHGQYIAHVDDTGTFTEKKFTLPSGWEGVDGVPLSDSMLILCRSENRMVNVSKVYQWDLVAASQFDDAITIPMGGPQWIENHKEAIKVCCAINGTMRMYQLNGSFPVETHTLSNIGTETTTQAISPAKCKATSDGKLYFGVLKTDKSGIYCIGQVEETKPNALILSKRFVPSGTSDYANHKPTALFIQGPNFYAAYYNSTTAAVSRCESLNSPSRSSDAVIETIWKDDGKPLNEKDLIRAYIKTYPLAASTSLAFSVQADQSGSYTEIKRPDNTAFNTASGLFGMLRPAAFRGKHMFKAKIAFTSSGTSSPKLQAIGLRMKIKDLENGGGN